MKNMYMMYITYVLYMLLYAELYAFLHWGSKLFKVFQSADKV